MTLQEKIQKKAEEYGQLAPVFLEGAKFALTNQWISVENDLPCNNEELLSENYRTKSVIVRFDNNLHGFCYMVKIDGKWCNLAKMVLAETDDKEAVTDADFVTDSDAFKSDYNEERYLDALDVAVKVLLWANIQPGGD